MAVQDARNDARIVEAEPRSARQPVKACDNIGPVGPMAGRGVPRAVAHFVAIGRNQHGPIGIWVAPNDDRTHQLPAPDGTKRD
jgi:hypothetical protein